MTSNVGNVQARETWVEFHDSRVAGTEQDSSGTYVVTFSHLNVFERISEEAYEVWSYRANLRISGASDVTLSMQIAEDDRVLDGAVILSNGTDVSQDTQRFGLGAQCLNCRVELHFSSGGILSVTGEAMTLEPIERLKFLERWVGPLKSS